MIGGNIRFYRKKNKLTIEKLAEIADISPKYLGSVERGENNISIDNVVKIAVALKVDMYKLFIIPENGNADMFEIIDLVAHAKKEKISAYTKILKEINNLKYD